jgi:hypothetical protein
MVGGELPVRLQDLALEFVRQRRRREQLPDLLAAPREVGDVLLAQAAEDVAQRTLQPAGAEEAPVRPP